MPDAGSPQDATLLAARLAAIETLVAGKTNAEAATAAGVHRNTLYNWLHKDIVFQAQLNEERRQLREQLLARLTRLADKAAAAVEHHLDEHDARVGISLLTRLGLLDGELPPIGSGDPAELKADLEYAQRREQSFRAAMTGDTFETRRL